MLPCRTDLILYKQVLFASEKRNLYKKKKKKNHKNMKNLKLFFLVGLNFVKTWISPQCLNYRKLLRAWTAPKPTSSPTLILKV